MKKKIKVKKKYNGAYKASLSLGKNLRPTFSKGNHVRRKSCKVEIT